MKSTAIKVLTSSFILASIIFLVNCDSTTRREIKAKVSDKAKQTAANYPPCNIKVNNAYDDRLENLIDIGKLTSESKVHDLDAAQKNELQKLVIDLKTISDTLIKEIQSIKSSNAQQAQGCNRPDTSAPGKKLSISILAIETENLKIAKEVASITKQRNSIIDESDDTQSDDGFQYEDPKKDESNGDDSNVDNSNVDNSNSDDSKNKNDSDSSKALSDDVLNINASYKVSKDFAEAMDLSNKDGKMYILEGAIHSDQKAEEELSQLNSKRDKSFCYLEMTSGKLNSEELISIKLINSVEHESKKALISQVIFADSTEKLYSLRCSTPTTEKDSSLKSIRANLKELILLNLDLK